MLKRIISIISAAACAAAMAVPVFAAKGLDIEQDFENFVPDTVFTAKEGGYAIKTDISNYLAVPQGATAGNAPVLEVDYGQNFVLEFEAKNGGAQQAIIEAQFEGGSYYRLFTLLADGRGPILRFADESPIFLYNTTDVKPTVSQWNKYRLEFNYGTKTISVYVNDEAIETYYDRSYSPVEPVFSGTKLQRLRFFNDTTKTGDACYDNIHVYTETGSGNVEFEDDIYKNAYLKLDALGGITDTVSGYPMERDLTRGEFTEMVISMLGLNVSSSSSQIYSDVGADNEHFAAINMANVMGYVAKAEKFRPDEPIKFVEAVTILCNINGYDKIADLNGGWPNGYISMAYKYKLTDNIKVIDQRQYMNMKDTCVLLANALTAPGMKVTFTGGGKAQYAEDEDETILYKFHKLKEIECFVEKYDTKQKLVTFTEHKTDNSYTAVYDSMGTDIENTMQYAWIGKDYETVKYMYFMKDSAVVYGYINSVNSSEDDRVYGPNQIRNVSASNCVKTSLSSNAVIKLNGEVLQTEVKPVGMYSRIVVTRGDITALDLYDITSGGMIESASEDKIVYFSGAYGYSVMEDISAVKPMKVILNNTMNSVKGLKANTYFDYLWIDGGLMVIASNEKTEGRLSSVGSDRIIIETEEKTIAYDKPISQFYISVDGDDYSTEHVASEYLNTQVVVYADSNRTARYMTAGESGSFYGVMAGYDDEDMEGKYPIIMIDRFENGTVARKTYEVNIKNKELFYPEVGYYEAIEHCRKTDGSGIYKFNEKNGIIRKIEQVEWYTGGAVTLGDKFDYRAVRVYFDGSWKGINQKQILILKDSLGDYKVRKVEWSELVNKFASGAKALISKNEPIADIMILTEYENAVYQDAVNFGFIENMNEYYGEDEEIHIQYDISKQGSTSKVDVLSDFELKYSGNTLGKYQFVMYAPGSLNKDISGMLIRGAINLKDSWQEQTVSSMKFVHMGNYLGTTKGYLKTSLNGETKYILMDTAGCSMYSTDKNHNKFKNASKSDLIGKDLWVISIGDIARGIFFEN